MALNMAILKLIGVKTYFQNLFVWFWKFTMYAILSKSVQL